MVKNSRGKNGKKGKKSRGRMSRGYFRRGGAPLTPAQIKILQEMNIDVDIAPDRLTELISAKEDVTEKAKLQGIVDQLNLIEAPAPDLSAAPDFSAEPDSSAALDTEDAPDSSDAPIYKKFVSFEDVKKTAMDRIAMQEDATKHASIIEGLIVNYTDNLTDDDKRKLREIVNPPKVEVGGRRKSKKRSKRRKTRRRKTRR